MDAVEKRAAGEVLSARDEQRLRNHQLRMMRRQYLHDITVSPREPLYVQNQVMQGARFRTKLANIKHFMQATMSGTFMPKDRLWTYKPILYTELFYGKSSNVPRLLAWSGFRFLTTFTVYLAPTFLVWTYMREQILHGRWPTFGGFLTDVLTEHAQLAATTQIYPSDKTFTTRLRNIEFGHDRLDVWSIRKESTARMNPEAVTYPLGTRMNWVNWQPILPEDNFMTDESYGNGPGGKGQATETYRLIHMTKERGVYSRNETW